ncbi:MAG TPA: PDZ domain-containing protein [Planctomycetota bacterium]|nr:PDZ domain-containing protein [Planctomycetota bacterium]
MVSAPRERVKPRRTLTSETTGALVAAQGSTGSEAATPSAGSPAHRAQSAVCLLAFLLWGCAGNCITNTPDEFVFEIHSRAVRVSEDEIAMLLPEPLRATPGEPVPPVRVSLRRNGELTVSRVLTSETTGIGIDVESMTEELAWARGIGGAQGIVITKSEGPARRAGIRLGDILLRADGLPIPNAGAWRAFLDQTEPGKRLTIELYRDRPVEVEVETVRTYELSEPREFSRDLRTFDDSRRTGLELIELPRDYQPLILGRTLETDALLVARLWPGTPAFFSDLRLGDVIVEIEGEPSGGVDGYRALTGSIERGDSFTAGYLLDDGIGQTEVDVGEDVLGERGANFLRLLNWHTRASRSRVGLLSGLLFHARRCYRIDHLVEHNAATDWGILFDLVRYTGRPNGKTLTLLWLLPLSFEGRSTSDRVPPLVERSRAIAWQSD